MNKDFGYLYIPIIQEITAVTDVDDNIWAVFGNSTATHPKPGKSKDPAGLSNTKLRFAFLSIGLVMPPSQTLSIISSGTGPAHTLYF